MLIESKSFHYCPLQFSNEASTNCKKNTCISPCLLRFEDLPIDILLLLQLFLPEKEFRRLLNTHKQIAKLKTKVCTLRLNPSYSVQFCQSEVFHNQICERVASQQNQIGINICIYHPNLAQELNFNRICYLHEVKIHHCTLTSLDLSHLHHIQSLHIHNSSKITNLPLFIEVQKLFLFNFMTLSDISKLSNIEEVSLIHCPAITDISALADAKTIHIEDCQAVTNFNCLGKQRFLSIVSSPIRDVNHLKNVFHLRLENCWGVTNVDHLGFVNQLDLIQCLNISSIEQLQSNQSLLIDRCFQIADYPSLGTSLLKTLSLKAVGVKEVHSFRHLRHLKLDSCNYITDVSALSELHSVHIEECFQLESLKGLAKVSKVVLVGLEKLEDLSGLSERNKHVFISRCNVRNFSPLKNIRTVEVICCRHFERCEEVCDVTFLTIRMCPKLVQISGLKEQLLQLKISQCKNLMTVNDVENVASIEISDCPNLKQAIELRNNKKLILRNCPLAMNIEELMVMSEVNIENCPNILQETQHVNGKENIIINNVTAKPARTANIWSSPVNLLNLVSQCLGTSH